MSVENPGMGFPVWNWKLHRNGGTTMMTRADKKERRRRKKKTVDAHYCRHSP